jgi:hypothetical protein
MPQFNLEIAKQTLDKNLEYLHGVCLHIAQDPRRGPVQSAAWTERCRRIEDAQDRIFQSALKVQLDELKQYTEWVTADTGQIRDYVQQLKTGERVVNFLGKVANLADAMINMAATAF